MKLDNSYKKNENCSSYSIVLMIPFWYVFAVSSYDAVAFQKVFQFKLTNQKADAQSMLIQYKHV